MALNGASKWLGKKTLRLENAQGWTMNSLTVAWAMNFVTIVGWSNQFFATICKRCHNIRNPLYCIEDAFEIHLIFPTFIFAFSSFPPNLRYSTLSSLHISIIGLSGCVIDRARRDWLCRRRSGIIGQIVFKSPFRGRYAAKGKKKSEAVSTRKTLFKIVVILWDNGE